MKSRLVAIILVIFGFFVVFGHRGVQAARSLDDLAIDFGSPSATLPLDRYAEHIFTITNRADHAATIAFTIHIQETDQEVVGWPQPQTLYFEAGETETVTT